MNKGAFNMLLEPSQSVLYMQPIRAPNLHFSGQFSLSPLHVEPVAEVCGREGEGWFSGSVSVHFCTHLMSVSFLHSNDHYLLHVGGRFEGDTRCSSGSFIIGLRVLNRAESNNCTVFGWFLNIHIYVFEQVSSVAMEFSIL